MLKRERRNCGPRRKVLCGRLECDVCVNRSIAKDSKWKHLVDMWHDDNYYEPHQLTYATNKRVTLTCRFCKHLLINVVVSEYPSDYKNCTFCSQHKTQLCGDLDCDSCRSRSLYNHPLAVEILLMWSSKNDLVPHAVAIYSNKQIWLFCATCNHHFDSTPNILSKKEVGKCCLFCVDNYKLCGVLTCAWCWQRSFLAHPAAQKMVGKWSLDNEVEPHEITAHSGYKASFDCGVCEHRVHMTCHSITSGQHCRFCSENTELCGKEDCDWCMKKSIIHHPAFKDLIPYWSPTNKLKPWQVTPGSEREIDFDCKCNHSFSKTPKHISRGQGCAYCANYKLCGKLSCKFCTDKSFLRDPRAAHMVTSWSKKNKVKAHQVFPMSNVKYYFDCKNCKSSSLIQLCNIVLHASGCGKCRHKTEKKLLDWFRTNTSHVPETQVTLPNCRNADGSKPYYFDFSFNDLKIIVELDGGQHFKQVSNWADPAVTQANDKFKMRCALKDGYTVVRLLQEDVWHNRNNWQQRLLKVLRIYDEPSLILLDNNGEYNIFRAKWAWKPMIVNKRRAPSSTESSPVSTKQRTSKRAGSTSSSSSSPRTSRVAGRDRGVIHIDVPTPGKRRVAIKRAR